LSKVWDIAAWQADTWDWTAWADASVPVGWKGHETLIFPLGGGFNYQLYKAQWKAEEIKTDTTTATDLTITTGAEKTLVLSSPVYDDIIIQAFNLRGGISPPTYDTFAGNVYGAKFINGQSDIVYGSFEIPHTYKEGTDLELHLHWSPNSTNTGNCVWTMYYTWAAMGGTFSSEVTKTFTQAGSGVINKHQYVSANSVMSGVGVGIGTIVAFALTRPTGDAFTGDAFLHSIGVHYQIDSLGSRQMAVK
jgi:hypothetical protein